MATAAIFLALILALPLSLAVSSSIAVLRTGTSASGSSRRSFLLVFLHGRRKTVSRLAISVIGRVLAAGGVVLALPASGRYGLSGRAATRLLLDVSLSLLKEAKVASVIIAMLLLLAIVDGLSASLRKWLGRSGLS